MRSPILGPIVRVVRDTRGLICSACPARPTAAVRIAQTHGHFDFCRECSRRIGVASDRLVDTDRNETEG